MTGMTYPQYQGALMSDALCPDCAAKYAQSLSTSTESGKD